MNARLLAVYLGTGERQVMEQLAASMQGNISSKNPRKIMTQRTLH